MWYELISRSKGWVLLTASLSPDRYHLPLNLPCWPSTHRMKDWVHRRSEFKCRLLFVVKLRPRHEPQLAESCHVMHLLLFLFCNTTQVADKTISKWSRYKRKPGMTAVRGVNHLWHLSNTNFPGSGGRCYVWPWEMTEREEQHDLSQPVPALVSWLRKWILKALPTGTPPRQGARGLGILLPWVGGCHFWKGDTSYHISIAGKEARTLCLLLKYKVGFCFLFA